MLAYNIASPGGLRRTRPAMQPRKALTNGSRPQTTSSSRCSRNRVLNLPVQSGEYEAAGMGEQMMDEQTVANLGRKLRQVIPHRL